MIITCGQCLAKFKVAPEQIKESGSKVRCSNCQHVFTVYRPGFEPDDREIDRPPLFYQPGDEPSGAEPERGAGAADDLYDQDESAGLFHEDGSYDDDEGEEGYGEEEYDDERDYGDDDGAEDSPEDEDNYYTAQYGGRAEDSEALSPRERRDRRRSLYADLGEEEEEAAEDDEELFYDEDELVDEDGRPPLRRASARAAKSRDEAYGGQAADGEEEYGDGEEYEDDGGEYEDGEEYEDEGEYEDGEDYEDGEEYEDDGGEYEDEEEYEDDGDYDDSADEDEYEDDVYSPPPRSGRRASLGLAADPVENMVGYIDDADYRSPGPGRKMADNQTIRAAITKVSGRSRLPLIIGGGLAVVLLVVVLILLFGRSSPTALSTGEEAGADTSAGQGLIETDTADSAGTKHISFTRGTQNHYLRQNEKAGQILIITGLVRNSYPEPRSYIRLRGHLLSQDGTSLADRFVYAGNLIAEEDLASLPMSEILARLSYKGGTDSKNINIPPGAEIPFMIVFDKLPDGMHEYRIDPVGSQPAN